MFDVSDFAVVLLLFLFLPLPKLAISLSILSMNSTISITMDSYNIRYIEFINTLTRLCRISGRIVIYCSDYTVLGLLRRN